MKYPLITEKNVLLTGCSSGIGRATAELLRAHGWRVVATARRDEDLQALQEDGFEAVRMEMADEESVAAGFAQARELLDGRVGALVNNAGYGQPGALEDLDRAQLRTQFEVNVLGLQQLANLCIPHFRTQGRGRIVNVTSVLGRITMPFMGAYCASKHAAESLSDALRLELREAGVAVAIVEPGPIKTSFSINSYAKLEQLAAGASPYREHYAREGQRYAAERAREGGLAQPPAAVAKCIAAALESPRPRKRYKVGLVAHYGAFMRRFAPDALIDFTFASYWKKRVPQ
jgi:NAD(P)-dependent dehydrogenase (short-subunit alcohol dehydrogenase family)